DRESMMRMIGTFGSNIDAETRRRLATVWRQSASPADVEVLCRMGDAIDVRNVLPAITVPTLLMNRAGEDRLIVDGSRYLAQHVSTARHVEFPGVDHMIMAGDTRPVITEIRRFLEDAWESGAEQEPDRVLATVLFSDIVGASEKAAALGDRA